jgi:hypothetical protein
MSCIPLADRESGSYPLEKMPDGWANAEDTDRRTGVSRYVILDLKTQICYLQEPLRMVAFKCLGLFLLLLPVYMLGYTAFHLIRLPFVTLANGSLKAFAKQIWAIVRIPFYSLLLEGAALYGVFKPLEGR